jgi:UDP-N-acetylglucosamine 2-epimerase (non-hydrolysing)
MLRVRRIKRLRVMTVLGTRPEIIKLSAVIRRLEESPAIEHVLVHTGQNYDYELNEVFFRDFHLRVPDFVLNAASPDASETIGNAIAKIVPVLDEVRPDAFLVLGDTNSCLCAIAAKRKHIPIFHMEAGNRCFDQRVPEETNRKIVDHIADINLPYTDIAREYLLREGFPPDRIIKTGSPMLEVINSRRTSIERSPILDTLGLTPKHYLVVSAHREENIDCDLNFAALIDSLNTVAAHTHLPVIMSTHPRTRKKLAAKGLELHPLINLHKPLGYSDYIKLQLHAKAVLSDSGTISEETSILGFPALNIRQAHERPEAMEETAVMMVGVSRERILQGLIVLENQTASTLRVVPDYSVPNVSDKVLRIILSYTDYVRRVVWGNC